MVDTDKVAAPARSGAPGVRSGPSGRVRYDPAYPRMLEPRRTASLPLISQVTQRAGQPALASQQVASLRPLGPPHSTHAPRRNTPRTGTRSRTRRAGVRAALEM